MYTTRRTFNLENIKRGATIQIIVNGVVYYTFEPTVPQEPLKITGGGLSPDYPFPFQLNDVVEITQSFDLCNITSSPTAPSKVVKSMFFSVEASLGAIASGHTTVISFAAVDTTTRDCLVGNTLISVDPTDLGTVSDPDGRGYQFSVTFAAGASDTGTQVQGFAVDEFEVDQVASCRIGIRVSVQGTEKERVGHREL